MNSQPVKTWIEKTENGFRLLRGGEPYYIRGAGIRDFQHLKAAGANSVRLWRMDDAMPRLDEAQANGMTVLAGFWIEHERHGFDYHDRGAVKAQLEELRAVVLKYRHHPAVLSWAVGNEMHIQYSNRKVWDAIEESVQLIKELDPLHPVMTVLAGPDKEAIEQVSERVPSVDLLGINMYGTIERLSYYLSKTAWKNRPYAVTEWGPVGHWECPQTAWGAPLEQSSAEKAAFYTRAYQSMLNDPYCLGSYYFLWGQKQERTPTWYGLFLEQDVQSGLKGEMQEMAESLAACWGGKTESVCPSVCGITVDNQNAADSISLKAGGSYTAVADADLNGRDARLIWEILEESHADSNGGDPEYRPESHPECLVIAEGKTLRFCAPQKAGAYRLFCYAVNAEGRAGAANFPFYCQD